MSTDHGSTTGTDHRSPAGTDHTAALRSVRAWVLDVDGCLMRTARPGGAGGTPMPRAGDLVAALRRAGHAVVICTNASQRPPAEYAAHLREQGIDVPDEDFVTAGSAAADHVAAHHPGARVLPVGDVGLAGPLAARGVEIATPGGPLADVVVVGAASEYRTEVINAACLAVDAGAALYTTVDTPWFHGGVGRSVTVSATIAHAIGWAAATSPQVLGKPSAFLAETLLRRLPGPPGRVAVVGDASAEIRLARAMGAVSTLVLSGAITPEKLAPLRGADRPDVVLDDVAALYDLLSESLPMTQGAPS
ncbi:HAD-IIA family hydrolase [Georgenia thermotolerans]|uniref:HAD hydrolase-like protein n=1 Tax=Georgenia thermotolerans TaxID=527326 RepID=A0A7J5UT25_9MICO|nr:HAD hydrolase-like protein [Georgenia thermotolerans]KAE8765460.1 HAD hydrolase-like protein [Georgenia thermotolerans]